MFSKLSAFTVAEYSMINAVIMRFISYGVINLEFSNLFDKYLFEIFKFIRVLGDLEFYFANNLRMHFWIPKKKAQTY